MGFNGGEGSGPWHYPLVDTYILCKHGYSCPNYLACHHCWQKYNLNSRYEQLV